MFWLLGTAKLLLLVQGTDPSVLGRIVDGSTGEPLANVVISLTDIDRTVVSDSRGRYAFASVPPGPQHLAVRRIGYGPRTLHALVPREGTVEINIALHAEPLRLPAIEVHSAVAVRGIEEGDWTAYPDRALSIEAVRNHPLLAEPDAFMALSGGEIAVMPESPSGIHVRGGASDQTAYLLDGVPVFSPYHAAGLFSAWNPDALEHLQLSSSTPSPAVPEALSGSVAGVTRAPGSRLNAQGSLSTTQARLTLDGPIAAGAGYLLSLRSGLPDITAPEEDASYLRGETGDLLAKLEIPVFGGRIRLLGYDSNNEISATASPDSVRNAFEWHSRSFGAQWSRQFGTVGLRVQGWRASSDAAVLWDPAGEAISMAAGRRDNGLVAEIQRSGEGATTAVGIRAQQSRTRYRTTPRAGFGSASFDVRSPIVASFFQHDQALGHGVSAVVGLSASAARSIYLSPQARISWAPLRELILSASYARSHQFAQSLRNPESVVDNIFPADVYVGVGSSTIPVARSDLGVLAVAYHPMTGVRLSGQVYLRGLDGILLVATRTGEPFATGQFASGSGSARGFSLDAAVSSSRYGLVASYGWQRLRQNDGRVSYVPNYGAVQTFEGGVIFFPSATTSLRLGATGAIGRRTTPLDSSVEWEACNLLDQGCEFGGSPRYRPDQLGGTDLPAYFRLDLGARKHWHLAIGDRDVQVALFGTVTNLLGRKNVLTLAPSAAGTRTVVEMRPRAPLVVGLDWRF
ncbi:MAG TPA: carboxypeptidase-like regulatory domain-containing protein [Gemmatimonadales bacterium]